MAFAYCPDCLARVNLTRIAKIDQMVTCWCCGAVLRVIDLNPLPLDWVTEAVGEGWEEDWDLEPVRVRASRPRS